MSEAKPIIPEHQHISGPCEICDAHRAKPATASQKLPAAVERMIQETLASEVAFARALRLQHPLNYGAKRFLYDRLFIQDEVDQALRQIAQATFAAARADEGQI